MSADLLAAMQHAEVEQIVAINDPHSGLLGFIVIHDTGRGPGIGGCRLAPYADQAAALADGIALAQAMTRKCALAGLNAGGAKGVFLQRPGADRRAMMRVLGRYVESLGGRFYTSGDLGIGPDDLAIVRETTRYVAVPDDDTLDLAGATATGVLAGMKCGLAAAGLSTDFKGLRVAVQGLGAMGSRVAARLVAAGARVVACDLDAAVQGARQAELDVRIVAPEAIYDEEVTVFCPCAVSGVLTEATVGRLKAQVVAGAANNQLGDAGADAAMRARGILYAPDYAVNAGAMILATRYLEGLPAGSADVSERIGRTVRRIFDEAEASGDPTGVVADRLTEKALVRPRSAEKQWWPVR
ncbi:MAG: Glu/Leu/Phe/Val dehydrogenase [Myxococcales bacterium]|nr:Glu/Leu/Phe/Val dehydrogenase [Myxococcales bacterium]